MISSIIILLFEFIYSAGKDVDIDKKICDEKQELIKGIKTDVEKKDLQSLFEKAKGSFKDFAKSLFDNPLSTQPDDLKYYEYILWGLDQGQNAVKKVFYDIKKNDPNNSYYKEYKINIELYLKHFKLRIFNKFLYFLIHGFIFLGGFFLSILVCYLLRKK